MTVTSTSQASYIYASNSVNKTSSTSQDTATQTTQTVDKMDEMKEKYKDVYTPIPETYSKADEDLQTQKIYEAYPDYVDFRDFFKILSTLEDGTPIQLGQELTSQQQEKIQSEKNKFYENVGGEKNFHDMQKNAQAIRDKYPVNHWRGDNEKEFARFENAAVYEGLESGKTLEEAKINARNLILPFMDVDNKIADASNQNFVETLVKAGRADSNALNIELEKEIIDFNAPNNSTMDLRKYGIDGSWESYNIYENQKAMITEIEKKISQFNFMSNNESLIKDAYSNLDGSYQDLGNNAGYKQLINDKYMPQMQQALNIFENYKIYDSVDIKV